MAKTADFDYHITEEIAVLSEDRKGWRTELNRVSWNGKEPKLDLRRWARNHSNMGKGVTLTDDEAGALLEALHGYFA